MSGILSSIGGWIAGLVFLGLALLIINGISVGINRITQGKKRCDAVVTLATLDMLKEAAPHDVSITPQGGVNIDLAHAIRTLFPDKGDVVSEADLRACAQRNRLLWAVTLDPWPTTDKDACAAASSALWNLLTPEQRKHTKLYPLSKSVGSSKQQLYVIVAGNIPGPPVMFSPSFDS